MKFRDDDPMLTAFALGELSAEESAPFEARLASDPELQREVDAIRAFAGRVTKELETEAAPGLSPEQRAALEARMGGRPVVHTAWFQARGALLLAAGLLLAVTIWYAVPRDERFHAPASEPSLEGADLDAFARRPSAPEEDSPKDKSFRKNDGSDLRFAGGSAVDRQRGQERLDETAKEEREKEMALVGYLAADAARLESDPRARSFDGDSKAPAPRSKAVDQEALARETRARSADDGLAPSKLGGEWERGAGSAEAPSGKALQTAAAPSEDRRDGAGAPAGPASPAVQQVQEIVRRAIPVGGGGQADGGRVEVGANAPAPAEAQVEARAKVAVVTGAVAVPQTALENDVLALDPSSAARPRDSVEVRFAAEGKALPPRAAESATAGAPAAARVLPADAENGLKKAAEDFAKTGLHLESFGKNVFEVDELSAVTSGNTETYDLVTDNAFVRTDVDPLSTFSIDVDTASYANVRRFLRQGVRPPKDAVRIEELVNYFPYADLPPSTGEPFRVHAEVALCPWNTANRLVRVSLKGREVPVDQRPPSNLVFLVDVSGSMRDEAKLPLVQQGLRMLVDRLGDDDRVSIVTYAGATRIALPSTHGGEKATILAAIDGLKAGGSTNGAAGIEMAYEMAAAGFVPGGTNRVLLATDGDFNVGITDRRALTRRIEEKAKGGVFLSVLGFGVGNLKDATMEQLADKGNGHYAYVDSVREAHKVLVDEMSATLVTIAKDVKIQLEFNPVLVGSWRQIGYENRALAHQDFADDRKDAGEVGAGHSVTALYEVAPPGTIAADLPGVAALRYQRFALVPTDAARSEELLAVRIRWKEPEASESRDVLHPVVDARLSYAQASDDFKFAAAVAAFGMILRESPYRGSASLDGVLELGAEASAVDPQGYRAEFLELVRRAKEIGVR